MIWAIILAAGESKRMGQPKMLLPYGEKTIVETVIDCALASMADEVLVVLGANREKIIKRIKNLSVKSVVNPNFSSGMLSSVQVGFKALPEEVESALVLLGDQPGITSAIIDRLLEAYGSSKKSIVVPIYQGSRGHPVLIDTKYREEIHSLHNEIGLRELLHNHPDEVLEVDLDEAEILQDVDNPEDYHQALEKKHKT